MMVSGELQATIHYLRDNNLVDRSRIDLDHHPDIKTLFPDPIAEGVRYYKKTGIFPINHGMVIRREIAEKHPWTVLNLLKAYDKANEIANQQRIAHVEYHVWAGLISAEAGKALREPAIRHGIKANRKTLETAAHVFARAGPDAAADEARRAVRAERDGAVAADGRRGHPPRRHGRHRHRRRARPRAGDGDGPLPRRRRCGVRGCRRLPRSPTRPPRVAGQPNMRHGARHPLRHHQPRRLRARCRRRRWRNSARCTCWSTTPPRARCIWSARPTPNR